jgi:hypothetical protein
LKTYRVANSNVLGKLGRSGDLVVVVNWSSIAALEAFDVDAEINAVKVTHSTSAKRREHTITIRARRSNRVKQSVKLGCILRDGFESF